MNLEELLAKAAAWAAQDPDAETKAELDSLIAAREEAALADRMATRLAFGTAGLRGELGAGPNRMNRVLVGQAAAGIAAFICEQALPSDELSVVIGFDGRINSAIFARDSAEIFAGAGIRASLFDGVVPTPVLAFAGKKMNATGAVMVTASHNPPRDNGYKVYLGGQNGGSQIVSPTDAHIADKIDEIAESKSFAELAKSDNLRIIGDEMRQAYISSVASLTGEVQNGETLRIVYTAMHGVGWHVVEPLFKAVGMAPLIPVMQQLLPDGNFPTVSFPNPEEPGAMDLSYAKAREVGADLILANDPDADRLAVAVPDASDPQGYRRLTGDQIGLILGDEMARRAAESGQYGNLACSIVSSSALSAVAKHYDLGYTETLTGFKWISKVPNLIFGFEEALGYCVDAANTPDKDGISAALIIADLASRLAINGKTLTSHLADLGEKYGHYATGQISIRVTDLSVISNLMAKLRSTPLAQIAGVNAKFTDLAIGSPDLGPTDGVRFDLADGRRVIVRPSGTEPKLKCYLQAVGSSAAEAAAALATVEESMLQILV